MVYGASDLHSRISQIRVVDADGALRHERRVVTSRERLVQAFDGHGPMRILVEASTESEWVAQALEAAGKSKAERQEAPESPRNARTGVSPGAGMNPSFLVT